MRFLTIRYVLFLALGLLGALGTWLALRPSNVAATPVAPPAEAEPAAADAAGSGEVEDAEPTTATITIVTTPSVRASVFWGRKLLGRMAPGRPLVVKRPRDSGPLDLMVRAQGYLPVQTRAHTFSDHRLLVKLTPPESKSELLGYRAPLDAGVDPTDEAALSAVASPDGGVAQSSAPPQTASGATPPVP